MASSRSSLTSASFGSRRAGENSPRTSDWQGPRAHGKRSRALFLREDEKPRIGHVGFTEEVTPPEQELLISQSATVLRRDSAASEKPDPQLEAKEKGFEKTVATFLTSIDLLLKKSSEPSNQPTNQRESIDRYSYEGTSIRGSTPQEDGGWQKVLRQFDNQFNSPDIHRLQDDVTHQSEQHQHQHQQQHQQQWQPDPLVLEIQQKKEELARQEQELKKKEADQQREQQEIILQKQKVEADLLFQQQAFLKEQEEQQEAEAERKRNELLKQQHELEIWKQAQELKLQQQQLEAEKLKQEEQEAEAERQRANLLKQQQQEIEIWKQAQELKQQQALLKEREEQKEAEVERQKEELARQQQEIELWKQKQQIKEQQQQLEAERWKQEQQELEAERARQQHQQEIAMWKLAQEEAALKQQQQQLEAERRKKEQQEAESERVREEQRIRQEEAYLKHQQLQLEERRRHEQQEAEAELMRQKQKTKQQESLLIQLKEEQLRHQQQQQQAEAERAKQQQEQEELILQAQKENTLLRERVQQQQLDLARERRVIEEMRLGKGKMATTPPQQVDVCHMQKLRASSPVDVPASVVRMSVSDRGTPSPLSRSSSPAGFDLLQCHGGGLKNDNYGGSQSQSPSPLDSLHIADLRSDVRSSPVREMVAGICSTPLAHSNSSVDVCTIPLGSFRVVSGSSPDTDTPSPKGIKRELHDTSQTRYSHVIVMVVSLLASFFERDLLKRYYLRWSGRRSRRSLASSLSAINSKATMRKYFILMKKLRVPEITTPVVISPPHSGFGFRPNISILERGISQLLIRQYFDKIKRYADGRYYARYRSLFLSRVSSRDQTRSNAFLLHRYFSNLLYFSKTRIISSTTSLQHKFYFRLLQLVHRRNYRHNSLESLIRGQDRASLLKGYFALLDHSKSRKSERTIQKAASKAVRKICHLNGKERHRELASKYFHKLWRNKTIMIEEKQRALTDKKMLTLISRSRKTVFRNMRKTSNFTLLIRYFQKLSNFVARSRAPRRFASFSATRTSHLTLLKYFSAWAKYPLLCREKITNAELNFTQQNISLLLNQSVSNSILKLFFSKLKAHRNLKKILTKAARDTSVNEDSLMGDYFRKMMKWWRLRKRADMLIVKMFYKKMVAATVKRHRAKRLSERCLASSQLVLMASRLQKWFSFCMDKKRRFTLSSQAATMQAIHIESLLKRFFNKLVVHREQRISLRQSIAVQLLSLQKWCCRSLMSIYYGRLAALLKLKNQQKLIASVRAFESWKQYRAVQHRSLKLARSLNEKASKKHLSIRFYSWIRLCRRRKRKLANQNVKRRICDIIIKRHVRVQRLAVFSKLKKHREIQMALRKMKGYCGSELLRRWWRRWLDVCKEASHVKQVLLLKKTLAATNNYYDSIIVSHEEAKREATSLLILCKSYWKLRNNVPTKRILRATPALIEMTTPLRGKTVPVRSQA